MSTNNNILTCVLFIATFCGLSITPVFARGAPTPARPPSMSNTVDPGNSNHSGKSSEKKKPRQDRRSEREYREFVRGYHSARALVLHGKYTEAIMAFRDLGHDDNPDVANYVGYAYRKLGDYDLSKVWYDKALAVDPNHVRTWEYYGLWHLEQGNRLKAQDFLEKIGLLCGDLTCREYVDLKAAIEEGRDNY
jgi:tetratricopeptide (TPR) repeat protein